VACGEESEGNSYLYLSPGTRISAPIVLAAADLDQVALRLNQRPRKALGFQTSAIKLQGSVASAG
jgi:IS30 family transposase